MGQSSSIVFSKEHSRSPSNNIVSGATGHSDNVVASASAEVRNTTEDGAAAAVVTGLPALADSASSQLKENLESLHNQLMQHAGADFDIATTTTLSYNQFLTYIIKLNEICRLYQDDEGRVLVFAVKKGSDSTIFWKATVRIACVKYHTGTRTTESHRLLTIRQFLQVFRRISYECTAGTLGSPPSPSHATAVSPAAAVAPTTAASAVLGELEGRAAAAQGDYAANSEMEECVICLERQPEVILPCAHAYCLPCIQQWWEYSAETPGDLLCNIQSFMAGNTFEKTCPVCRETIAGDDDTWVISEAPDDAQVTHEIRQALMGLAESSSNAGGEYSGGQLSRRTR